MRLLSTLSMLAAPFVVALALAVPAAHAQTAPDNFLDEISGQFENSARKMVALAEAMPAESYGWQPDEGVMSVVRVYMHIANYNYMYPHQNMGIDPGEGAGYDEWEDMITDKERAVLTLERSMDHVRWVLSNISEADLHRPTMLYGRQVAQWAVLLQLVTHMNEHLGQSIAYARMNGVTPPWSR